MSRSGYVDGLDNWTLICWRGAVASSLRGKRGQRLLNELADAMDAMPEKRLIANDLEAGGDVCALGAVGRVRGLDMQEIDPEDSERVSEVFDIADALAKEIVFENDEGTFHDETPEQRWSRMRKWVARNLAEENLAA
ncbi:MAG TPA: hypothetical protein VFM75_02010 [Modicisalibacter sp.]|nr:hypothetical protein [Modicisalibacter sp.]